MIFWIRTNFKLKSRHGTSSVFISLQCFYIHCKWFFCFFYCYLKAWSVESQVITLWTRDISAHADLWKWSSASTLLFFFVMSANGILGSGVSIVRIFWLHPLRPPPSLKFRKYFEGTVAFFFFFKHLFLWGFFAHGRIIWLCWRFIGFRHFFIFFF